MKLQGGIQLNESGLSQSIRSMHLQTALLGIANDNITGFDKIGYQRKIPVVSSFAEHIGIHALSTAVDDKVGRLLNTNNPLDFAMAQKGYFQTLDKDGSIKLTRDGRFMLNKNGELLTQEGAKVLSDAGLPIILPSLPEKLDDIKVSTGGVISMFDAATQKFNPVGKIGAVTTEGAAVINPDIRQGYSEYSNVVMSSEFMELVPVRRNFEANRQLYIIQSNNLTTAIQKLGQA